MDTVSLHDTLPPLPAVSVNWEVVGEVNEVPDI